MFAPGHPERMQPGSDAERQNKCGSGDQNGKMAHESPLCVECARECASHSLRCGRVVSVCDERSTPPDWQARCRARRP